MALLHLIKNTEITLLKIHSNSVLPSILGRAVRSKFTYWGFESIINFHVVTYSYPDTLGPMFTLGFWSQILLASVSPPPLKQDTILHIYLTGKIICYFIRYILIFKFLRWKDKMSEPNYLIKTVYFLRENNCIAISKISFSNKYITTYYTNFVFFTLQSRTVSIHLAFRTKK